ncbi:MULTISPECIES: hypothetical protein [unclassified Leptolyngbya]|uniref:hypothetical protein n=1 Tax=unclassified Leptolyngbya TaxID=2650499 RepID=UPI0016845046|nr:MULTISPECIES: hypothetical protein [unclassified Leptolyngbya]MBD1913205.1 hypothetical protein [Leptolyngbya sp. FACHB-8]MBD2154928.1 hypothetical protein [Leptolyngbya sp. FACHB-16]
MIPKSEKIFRLFNPHNPTVIPKSSNWSSRHHAIGYWFLTPDPAYVPLSGLINFLEADLLPFALILAA